ncbi:hypothetical protein AB1N83_010668 [Pleurotus pulmonarius]
MGWDCEYGCATDSGKRVLSSMWTGDQGKSSFGRAWRARVKLLASFTGRFFDSSIMSTYYKFGGFEPSFRWFTFSLPKLADAIAGDKSRLRPTDTKGPVQVTLGIGKSGASSLLLSDAQFQTLWRVYGGVERAPNPSRIFSPQDFESLSPIEFDGADSLLRKLKKLEPRKTKSSYDTSQENKVYHDAANAGDGLLRGAFELNRCLYRLLNGGIDTRQFALNGECASKIRICSLVINTWTQDGRSAEARKREPKILDVGVTSLDASTPTPQAARTSRHFMVKGNNMLNKEARKDFQYGSSVEATFADIASELRTFLSPGPVVLLVVGADVTTDLLNAIGVDTSSWTRGIKTLILDDNTPASRPRPSYRREAEAPTYRSRSRSPTRPNFHSHSNSYYSSRSSTAPRAPRPPHPPHPPHPTHPPRPTHLPRPTHTPSASPPSPRPRAYRPVYTVDVRQMYEKLKKTGNRDHVHRIAEYLQVEAQPPLGATHAGANNNNTAPGTASATAGAGAAKRTGSICAGNEARLLIDIWAAMASGAAIDEQHEERAMAQKAREASLRAGPSQPGTKVESGATAGAPTGSGGENNDDDDDDDDVDPFTSMQEAIQEQESSSVDPGFDYYDMDSDHGSDMD